MIKINLKNNKGFTLVELLVTLAISSVILGLVVSFFIMNIKNFDRSEHQLDLQYESQFAMNYITDLIMEGERISYIENINNSIKTLSNGVVKVREIRIITKKIDESSLNVTTREEIFTVDEDSRKIYHGDKEIGDYVDEVIVETVPSNMSYSEARGIIITISLSKANLKKSITSQVFFRNFEE